MKQARKDNMSKLQRSYNPSITTLLKRSKSHTQLEQIHAHIIHKGLEQDQYIISHFLSLSNFLSPLSYSLSLFSQVSIPQTVLYNSLLKGYSKNSNFTETINGFLRMLRMGLCPDEYTFPILFKVCAAELRLKEGHTVHAFTRKLGLNDEVYVGTSLVDFYGKCGDVVSARKVFDEMWIRNVVTWTALVNGYVTVGDMVEAKRVFDSMPEKNVMSWKVLVSGFVKVGDLESARVVFDQMGERDVVAFTIMIDGYAKAGDMVSARWLFDRAPKRDVVAWSALISGYAQNGQANEAVKVFIEMDGLKVRPDSYVMVSLMSACSQLGSLDLAKWVDSYLGESCIDLGQPHVVAALVDMNVKCGNMERAIELFENMPKRDMISYCSMIQGLSIHGNGAQAVRLFNRMLDEGLTPDDVAFTVILTACCRSRLVNEACDLFESMKCKYSISPSPDHYACMVDLLSRSGRLKVAYELIKSMPVEVNACAWGALLGACRLHGDIELGEEVGKRLFEIEPNNGGNYVLLSNIYAAADMWLDVSLVRSKMKERGVRKVPGCTWI